MRKPIFHQIYICLWMALALTLAAGLNPRMVHAATTDPTLRDTDGDGYLDGPDAWVDMGEAGLWLRCGEDKDGDGKYEPEGEDGILGTEDDEYDPNNPSSHPTADEPIIAYDTDKDEINNEMEDEFGTNPIDMDTDDDGVKDGDEVYIYHTNPNSPDTDMDGLPDGFELGLTASIDGTGRNEYNTQWFDHIGKPEGYLFRIKDDIVSAYYQSTFFPTTNAAYRSDPRSIDSDLDHISDLSEYLQNPQTDPMRGLVRGVDSSETEVSFRRTEFPDYIEGCMPVNKDYKIYLNKVMGDDDQYHWETVLTISLGQTPATGITLSTTQGLNVYQNENGQYVSSIEVNQNTIEPYMGQYMLKQVLLRSPEPLPATLNVTIDCGGGDIREYSVGLNRYYVDYE